MSELSRRGLLVAASGGVVALAACTGSSSPGAGADEGRDDPERAPEPTSAEPAAVAESTALSGDGPAVAAGLSALLLQSSPVAVLTAGTAEQVRAAGALAATGHWPVLLIDADGGLPEPTRTELTRLQVEHVIVVAPATAAEQDGTPTPDQSGTSTSVPTPAPTPTVEIAGVEVHVVPASASPSVPPEVPVGPAPAPVDVVVLAADEAAAEAEDHPAQAALATAHALGARTHTQVVDPREDSTLMAGLRETADTPLITLGADTAAADRLLVMSTMAQRAPELPGGGVSLFPHRRMVALYGHPGAGVLGLLGEQGIEGSITRVNGYVEKYAPLVTEPVIPSWEIIASVATGGAGPDGNYSKVWEPEKFRPWVDAAKEAGIYVVLDLQPGRSDFLTQAKEYEELLVEPHVGLALDPEWRLGPNEKHLRRIGHVEAAEINAVSDWLAALVREHNLPQKVLTLHQFQLQMIRDRDQVRTDHPELAVVLHADGQGPQGAKQETWRVLKADLPEGMWLGWKNFYDEDSPMLTPEQTIARVEPTPWFISYQ